jgi:hypothetical protein
MEVIMGLMGLICAVVLSLLASELYAWFPKLADKLLRFYAKQLPTAIAPRLLEEWQALLADTPGNLAKLLRALDLIRALPRIKGGQTFLAAPFGGLAGDWPILAPRAAPPRVGYRLITGHIWWEFIHKELLRYRALRASGLKLNFPPPGLALRTSQGFYFTDRESLEGITLPEEFARRFGLSSKAQQECQLYGCAIVKFHLPERGSVVVPDPYKDQPPGLSPGGGREWKTNFNLSLDSSMEVVYIYRDENSTVRHSNVPL